MGDSVEHLKEFARRVRLDVLDLTKSAKSSHVGSAFSAVELLTVLYNGSMNVSPECIDSLSRDKFVLSKGHAVAVLYAVLSAKGFFPRSWLDSFYKDDTYLAGHATSKMIPGIEISTGSLGHGLPIGCGFAYAAKLDGLSSRTWVMISDGECDEGTTWEAALFAAHHRLNNLVVIIDYNKIQSIGTVEEVLGLEPIAEKWSSFGWTVIEVDGHNLVQISEAFESASAAQRAPTVVIAHTIKGKGVSFMENTVLWHYRSPQGDEYEDAKSEILENH